jgi:excisionase family DNA binding protein
MNKEQAAKALGMTVRTLQRHMAAHRIGFAMRRTATGEEATFSSEEVARFKAERDTLTTTVTPAAVDVSEVVRDSPPLQALQRVDGEQGIAMLVSAITTALQAARSPQIATPPVELKDKLMLTIRDAAALTSLSSGYLKQAIHAGQLKAKIIGRGWRIKRDDLNKYVGKL